MIEFNDLLQKSGIDPAGVMVMRHRPTEAALRSALMTLAVEQPEVYNTYQSQHGPVVERALERAQWLASFIGHSPGKALFVGMYRVLGSKKLKPKAFWSLPGNAQLRALGTRGPREGHEPRFFDLRLEAPLSRYQGKLVLEWTGIERSWWRWAARNTFPVDAIAPESLLVRPMPDWQRLVLAWSELAFLPASWRAALAQWRGVYYIFDRAAGKGYVGSAYGADNLLGRWTGYAATGHGGNKLLRDRKPEDFLFSILQRVAPDAEPSEVVEVENAWKDRLHTRAPHGLNDN